MSAALRLALPSAARAVSTSSAVRLAARAMSTAAATSTPSTSLPARRHSALLTPPRTRALSSSTRTKLETLTHSAPLVLFMKGTPDMPMCGFSRAVIQILDVQGVDLRRSGVVKAVNVLEEEEIRQGVKEFSDWPTIPQVYVGGEFVGGCDIMLDMHKSGELEDLLVKHGIIQALPSQESQPEQASTPSN